MWLFPFQNKILKTSLNRSEIKQMLLQNTFLSDEGYFRKDDHKKFFYGTVSKEEFELETIEKKDKLAAYFNGSIRGVENDMFIFLAIRAFRHRRVFVLFLLFILICAAWMLMQLAETGIRAFSQTDSKILFAVILALLGYLLWVGRQLDKRVNTSVDFFRGMLQADIVKLQDVPIIFQSA